MIANKPQTEQIAGLVAWVLAFICSTPILVAGYLLFSHTAAWLKLGRWPNYTTAQMLLDMGIAPSPSKWIGFQNLVDLAMSFPAAGSLVFLSLLLGLTLGKFAESIHDFK